MSTERDAIEKQVAEELFGTDSSVATSLIYHRTIKSLSNVEWKLWDALVAARLKLAGVERERDDDGRRLENWKNVCASDIFQELKHGKYRAILNLLADGQISIGKAAQSIAEWAHSGIDPQLPPYQEADEGGDISWKARAESASLKLAAADRTIEQALALERKLSEVHVDPEYESVWIIAQMHRGQYTGPTYSDELAALRSALLEYSRTTV